MFLKHEYPERVSGTASTGERTRRSLPDSSVGNVPTHGEKTGQCKKLRGKFINCYLCFQIHSLWS